HFNTGDPQRPADFALVDEYRDQLRHKGVLGRLMVLKNVDDVLKEIEARPLPQPILTLSIDDVAPDAKKKDEDTHLLLREPPRDLKVPIDRLPTLADPAEVSGQLNNDPPRAFPAPSAPQQSVDLTGLPWKPGIFTFRAQAVTREKEPKTVSQLLTIRYQPAPPK